MAALVLALLAVASQLPGAEARLQLASAQRDGGRQGSGRNGADFARGEVVLELPGMFRVRESPGDGGISVQRLHHRATSLLSHSSSYVTKARKRRHNRGSRILAGRSGSSMKLDVPFYAAHGIDARGDRFTSIGKSKILVATVIIPDKSSTFSDLEHKDDNDWVSLVLNHTTEHVRRFRHSMAVRQRLISPTPKWQAEECQGPEGLKKYLSKENCIWAKHRENVNWEKFKMVLDYFEGRPELFTHVLFLDADATFMNIDPKHDTVKRMQQYMDSKGASLLIADENWRGKAGKGVANGGVHMWRNTEYSRTLLRALLRAHHEGLDTKERFACISNEQNCIQMHIGTRGEPPQRGGLVNVTQLEGPKKGSQRKPNVLLLSGMQYNRHPCALTSCSQQAHIDDFPRDGARTITDPSLEIMHFMGGSKGAIYNLLGNRKQ